MRNYSLSALHSDSSNNKVSSTSRVYHSHSARNVPCDLIGRNDSVGYTRQRMSCTSNVKNKCNSHVWQAVIAQVEIIRHGDSETVVKISFQLCNPWLVLLFPQSKKRVTYLEILLIESICIVSDQTIRYSLFMKIWQIENAVQRRSLRCIEVLMTGNPGP